MKKFSISTLLLSTLFTAVIGSSIESSAHNTGGKDHTKAAHKVSHHSKKNHKKHDDAYSPSMYKGSHKAHHNHHGKEPLAYAVAPSHLIAKHKSHDSLVNTNSLSVRVGGKVDIQHGFIDQKQEFKIAANNGNLPGIDDLGGITVDVTKNSKYTNPHAMTSNGELVFSALKEMQGHKYGANIKVNANTSPTSSGNKNVSNTVFLFMENKIGRFEAGAVDGVSEYMAISAASIAKATGGIDGNYMSWIPYKALSTPDGTNHSYILDNIFLSSPSLPFDAQSAKKANKINYYTPTFNGFKGGLAYVRDSTVQGTTYEALDFKGTGYKNVVELGLSYEHKLNLISFALSAAGKTGQARDVYVTGTDKPITLNKLSAWQVGGKVSYGPFAVATSYGDWGKSGTASPTKATPKRQQNFWTAGLAFTNIKGGASLTYMSSSRRGAFSLDAQKFITKDAATQDAYDSAKNKVKSLVLGVEYKVMPGLMPYAEVASFKYQSPLVDQKLIMANKGTIVLGGVKLNF